MGAQDSEPVFPGPPSPGAAVPPGQDGSGTAFRRPVFQPLAADDPTGVSGYRISARLGAGGDGDSHPGGRVYLAHAPGGAPVALRLFAAETAARPGLAERFPHDAHALRQVNGPYTVPVVDSGTDGARPWLAAAYVPGLSLRAAVFTAGPLPVPSVLRLVAGIAEALRTVHHAGLVHGDLSPSHVLLAADGPRVKDFGLTGITGPAPAALDGNDGDPAPPVFASPEQAAGKPSGPATDVFALGQIAAYASTGMAPFGDGPAATVLPRVAQEEPDLSELPGELREIVTRCLIKDPALRPSPAQIIAMCAQAAPDASRRRADRWLPPALLAAIVPAMPPPAPPIPGSPPVAGPPGQLHYGWARPPVPHFPPHRPHLPHLPLRPAWPARPSTRGRGTGVVAAVAALAVAVTAGVALAGGFESGGDSHRAAAAPTTPAEGGAAPTARPSDPPSGTDGGADGGADEGDGGATGAPEQPPGSSYQGVQLPAGYGLSLTDDPPIAHPGTLTGAIGYTENADAFATDSGHGTLTLLDPSLPGTLAGCQSGGPESTSIPRQSVTPGSRVCVHTTDGTIALVTFRALTPPGAPTPSAGLDLTIWRPTPRSAEENQNPPTSPALNPAAYVPLAAT